MPLDDMRFLTKPGSMVGTFTIIYHSKSRPNATVNMPYVCILSDSTHHKKSGNVLLELG